MSTYAIKKGISLPYRMRSGASPIIKHYLETASQTFIAGDFVYLTSNCLTHCGSDPSAILGMALADATNTTGTDRSYIPVLVFTDDLELTMQLYHATAASATFTDQSGKGTAYEIVDHASGTWMVDVAATSATRVTVVDYSDEDLGNLYMPVVVRFTTANLQLP